MSDIIVPEDKRIFLAYPFTEYYKRGAVREIESELGHIVDALQRKGKFCVGYCSIYDEEQFKIQELEWDDRYKYTMEQMDGCGVIGLYVPTNIFSQGRVDEAIEAHKRGMESFFMCKEGIDWRENHRDLAQIYSQERYVPKVIEYSNPKIDLREKLFNLKLD